MYLFKNLESKYELQRKNKRASSRYVLAAAILLALGSIGASVPILSSKYTRHSSPSPVSQPLSSLENRTLQTEVILPKNSLQVLCSPPIHVQAQKDKRKDYQYDDLIEKYCSKNDFDFHLIKGMIYTESSFNPKARGKDGEIGLMQLKLSTARLIDPNVTEADLENPEINIRIGTEYLSKHFSRFQSADSALVAYNCGPNIFKNKKVFSNTKVTRYPARIHNARQVYKKGKSFFS